MGDMKELSGTYHNHNSYPFELPNSQQPLLKHLIIEYEGFIIY